MKPRKTHQTTNLHFPGQRTERDHLHAAIPATVILRTCSFFESLGIEHADETPARQREKSVSHSILFKSNLLLRAGSYFVRASHGR